MGRVRIFPLLLEDQYRYWQSQIYYLVTHIHITSYPPVRRSFWWKRVLPLILLIPEGKSKSFMRDRVCFKICQILRGAIVPHLVHGSFGPVMNAAHLQWPEYNKTDPVWNDKSMGIIRAKSLYTYYFSIYSNPIKPLELYVHSAAFSLKRSPMGFYIWLHLYKIFSWVEFLFRLSQKYFTL